MDGDKSEESGAFYFPDASQISAMVVDHSRQMKTQICTFGDVGDGFRSLPIPYIAGLQSPITNKHGFSRESGIDFWRLSDISAKSGMVGNN